MNGRAILLTAACLALASCGGEQYSDLKQFVKESDNLPRGRIAPLPEVKPYEPFPYNAYDLTDPFKPRKLEPPKTAAGGGIQPDLTRRKEPLEAYPLENLRMVGTLHQNKVTYALVKSPDSNLFRVKAGNYVGQNFGLITDISESNIKLKEIVQDSGGDWTERISTMTLIEEGAK
jgi:type IV pilus assembly protein PilP